MIRWPLAREPPMSGGVLSDARPLNRAQAPTYAGMPSDLIIPVVGTHR